MAEKLLEMQKQLLEITSLPLQIRETIAMVTKALEQYMPMEEAESNGEIKSREESFERDNESNEQSVEEQSEEQYNADYEKEYNRILDFQSEDTETLEGPNENQEGSEIEEQSVEDPEEVYRHQIEQEEIEMMKRQKQQKIQTLEKSWQKLCGAEKKVYK